MKTAHLKVGDKIKCKYAQGQFFAVIEKINRPFFEVDITQYVGYPNVAITAQITVHSRDIIEKCK